MQLISEGHFNQRANDHSEMPSCLTAELSPLSFALILGQIEKLEVSNKEQCCKVDITVDQVIHTHRKCSNISFVITEHRLLGFSILSWKALALMLVAGVCCPGLQEQLCTLLRCTSSCSVFRTCVFLTKAIDAHLMFALCCEQHLCFFIISFW